MSTRPLGVARGALGVVAPGRLVDLSELVGETGGIDAQRQLHERSVKAHGAHHRSGGSIR
jgi:hypothetical protein